MSSLSEDKGAGHGNTLEKEKRLSEVVKTNRAPNLRKLLPTNFRS
jgi:hypothetical protein